MRPPRSDENGLKKGPWSPDEDQKLVQHIRKHGLGNWSTLSKLAGLNRCGKSCRLRWTNYLRPDIKRGKFSIEEEQTILNLHSVLGNKWSAIAAHLPGRTDNEIKNFWNTNLKKRLIQMDIDPVTHQPRWSLFSRLPQLMALAGRTDITDHSSFSQYGITKTIEALNLMNLNLGSPFSNANATSPLLRLAHPQPQVPFTFQTPSNGDMGVGCSSTLVSHGGDHPPNPPWPLPTPGSSSPSPPSQPLIRNQAGGSSSSIPGHGDGESFPWAELLFEDPFTYETSQLLLG